MSDEAHVRIISRKEAISLGLEKYFTGKPCKNGHVDLRYVKSGTCMECRRKISEKHRNTEYGKKYFSDYNTNWRENNKDHVREYKSQYRISNLEKHAADERRRRARKSGTETTHSYDDVRDILQKQKHKCAEPTFAKDLSDGYHVDHIMPLALGGDNSKRNIQCLCPKCNLKKHAKHPYDWAMENGRLF